MIIYAVDRMNKLDYDFSVSMIKCGCFYIKERALQKAKEVYETMCGEYEDDMVKYADEDDEASGKTYIEEDAENGYYLIAFGRDEEYECHVVSVEEYEIPFWDRELMYEDMKQSDESLIENIKRKLEDKGDEHVVTKNDLENMACRVRKVFYDNEIDVTKSYWSTLENVIDNYFKEV